MYLFINFKAYNESTGKNAKELISKLEERFRGDKRIIFVLNPLDSLLETNFDKYIQHADTVSIGPFTGFLPIPLLTKYDYKGIMINHSEHKLNGSVRRESIAMSKSVGLRTLVCASDLEEIKEMSVFKPDMIAYEPPELIGGDISVSVSRPGVIKSAYELLKGSGTELVVGAGVKNGEDVKISVELGAKGVLVASGIVKSKNPIEVIEEMLENLGD